MPNHITTAFEIVGEKEAIEKLIKDTKVTLEKDVENQFDFNGIIPMPPELQITSGLSTDIGMAAYSQDYYDKNIGPKCAWWPERYPNVTDSKSLLKFLTDHKDENGNEQALKEGKQALENIEKHGYKDWYDWSIANWGTKWGAYDVKYIDHDDTHLVMEITTAWGTPTEIWEKLEEMGFTVSGIVYGEMEGTDTIGDGGPFYINTSVEYER